MSTECDILIEVPKDDIPKLRDYYKEHVPYATYIYSFLNTLLKWNKKKPEKKFCEIYAPNGDWQSDGTFIAILEFHCYNVMMFTMDKECKRLQDALIKTNKIDYNRHVFLYAVHKDFREAVLNVLKIRNLSIHYEYKTDLWWTTHQKAAEFTYECPPEFYIDTLKPEHASIVNEEWAIRYSGSVEFIRTFIEMSGGHGVFQKSDDKLVAWILKNHMGTLATLQTDENYKRRGLASIITKSLSKEIGLEGHNPTGTVMFDNVASAELFKKLGFEILDWLTFIGTGRK